VYAENITQLPAKLRLIVGGRFDVYSDFGNAVSPRAGVTWRSGGLGLKAFYGWAFRAPTFEELYDQTAQIDLGAFLGNEDLAASRIKTAEVGASYRLSLRSALVTIGVTGFHSQITDSIDRAPLFGEDNVFLNSSDITTYGGSGEVRLDLLERYTLFGNASWYTAESDFAYVFMDQDEFSVTQLRAVPQFRANGGARARWGRYRAGSHVEIGGRRKNNERTQLEGQLFFDYPGYQLVDMYAQVDRILFPGTYLRVQATNVLNQAVADEPFRPNRMRKGIPRDKLRAMLVLGATF
jgi:outer membrane receptor for ferrienterochelin and colicin